MRISRRKRKEGWKSVLGLKENYLPSPVEPKRGEKRSQVSEGIELGGPLEILDEHGQPLFPKEKIQYG